MIGKTLGHYQITEKLGEGGMGVVYKARDTMPRRLTKSADSSKTRPSWSQDGRWIYFTSDLSGRNEIWKIPVGGGEAVQVTRSGGAAALQSPDGQYLYYVKEPRPPGLFRMPAEGGEEKQLLPDLGSAGRWGSFAVTARGVYFTVPGANTIQFLDAATGRLSVLATLDKQIALGLLTAGGLGVVGLCVSPDDAYVVWAQVDRNAQDLMLVENFR